MAETKTSGPGKASRMMTMYCGEAAAATPSSVRRSERKRPAIPPVSGTNTNAILRTPPGTSSRKKKKKAPATTQTPSSQDHNVDAGYTYKEVPTPRQVMQEVPDNLTGGSASGESSVKLRPKSEADLPQIHVDNIRNEIEEDPVRRLSFEKMADSMDTVDPVSPVLNQPKVCI